MDSFFIQHGSEYHLTTEASTVIHKMLPKGIYDVHFSQFRGYYLIEKVDSKPLPPKLYGSLLTRADRIIRTYNERRAMQLQTGVLLSGEKGSGKTLLARFLSEAVNMPTVVVSEPFTDQDFLTLLCAGGPKLVLFDEFEKVYHDRDKQTALLTMLDGHYAIDNLTVATVNDSGGVISAMINRPSRFYYHYRYISLEREFVDDYCADRLKTPTAELIRAVHDVATKVWGFNFDMLQALIEEMNRFGDSPAECIKHINIIPSENGYRYRVVMTNIKTGTAVNVEEDHVRTTSLQPIHMYFNLVRKDGKKDDKVVSFDGTDFVAMEERNLIFESEGFRATLTPLFNVHGWAI